MNETSINLKSYIFGFILSVIFILVAFGTVTFTNTHQASPLLQGEIIAIIFIVAIIQAIVKLVCFLHIGTDLKSRVQTTILVCSIIGIGIMVSGSIWIMYHLNYNMTPSEMTSTIIEDEGFLMGSTALPITATSTMK